MILQLTVLRRLDGVLAPTKEEVLREYERLPSGIDAVLNNITGVQFNNVSESDLRKVLEDLRTLPTSCAGTSPGSRRTCGRSSKSSTWTPLCSTRPAKPAGCCPSPNYTLTRVTLTLHLKFIDRRLAPGPTRFVTRPAAVANVSHEILEVGRKDLCRVHVKPSSFPVEANVVAVDKNGQHAKKTAFYGRFGNGTREIPDPGERERYKAQVWGT